MRDFVVELKYLVAAVGRIEVWLVTVSSPDQIHHPVFLSLDTLGLALVVWLYFIITEKFVTL